MPLPVTITGISTAVAPVGPFKVAAGSYSDYTKFSTGAQSTSVSSSTLHHSQSLTIGSSGITVTSIKFILVGASPNLATGTFQCIVKSGSNTGTTVATSTNTFDLTTLLAGLPLDVIFNFSEFTLSASTQYFVQLIRTGAAALLSYRNVTPDLAGETRYSSSDNVVWNTGAGDLWLELRGNIVIPTDAYYFFGRDGTTATTLQAYKSTAPDTSWASVITKTGFTTAILNIAAYQVGNVIHMAVQDGTMSSSVATKYVSFDAVADTFLATIETILAASVLTGQATSGWGVSLVVRSNNEVVCLYNSTATNTSGTPRARLGYKRRTAVNTWSAAVQVDPNTAFDSTTPVAVSGALNRVHFFWSLGGTTGYRTLSAANALPTGASSASMVGPGDGVSYDRSGTIKVVITNNANGAQTTARFDSSDAPTVTFANQGIAAATIPHRIGTFPNTDDVTIVYRSSADSDLYSIKSSDDGATFGAPVSFFVGTVANADANVSRSSSGSVYTRESNNVVGYIVNDGGTLKYNEYTLSSAGITGTLSVTEAADTISAAGTVAGGAPAITGALNVTEANDTVAAQATVTVRGTLSATEVNDTLSSAATVRVGGTLSVTEASDTISAAGGPVVRGTLSATEANDTLAAAGTVAAGAAITGTLNVTEANDALAALATVTVRGVLNATEANDVILAAGTVSVSGALNVTEANDTISATATVRVGGTLNVTEANDTIAALARVAISGALSAAEANDTLSADGEVGYPSVRGALNVTEASDTLVAAAGSVVGGALGVLEANDTITALAVSVIGGALNVTEANDTLAAAAKVIAGGEWTLSDRTVAVQTEDRTAEVLAELLVVQAVAEVRTVAAVVEDRTVVVPAVDDTAEPAVEMRDAIGPAESRIVAAPAEIRAVAAAVESRTVTVLAEGRSIAASAETRSIQSAGESHGVSQMVAQRSRRSPGLQHRLVAAAYFS